MSRIIDQRFGQNWAFYHADCKFMMANLPDNSVDFMVYSLPFLSLYIYSDSIADLGNTDSESQFYDGYRFHLQEQFRILKPGQAIAIHCKDMMRYMTSHDYAGLYDFPGQIVQLAESVGFVFDRWITIWKDPVIEMQRTKTYGLLHKSFKERAEVTRQGCADYVLILRKPPFKAVKQLLLSVNQQVIARCVEIWTNQNEKIHTVLGRDIRGRVESSSEYAYSFWSGEYNLQEILANTPPGRLTTIHCTTQQMVSLIDEFQATDKWKFHSRCALTDGSYLVTFRNWTGEIKAGAVQHGLKAPASSFWQDVQEMNENGVIETFKKYFSNKNSAHPDYVGTNPPIGWKDDGYYSILVWQRYASPVWFDLEGLPKVHPDSWMDIVQTNVLNYRKAKSEEEEKHICPLQLDLIDRLILEYTQPGEIILSPYGGIGSEPVEAIKLGRKAIASELKQSYWQLGCKNLAVMEQAITQKGMML